MIVESVYGVPVDELKAETNTFFPGDSALYSADEKYRYLLRRTMEPENMRTVMWIMLNPSTATASTNDATIRRVIGFSAREGYGRLVVCNLYAYRSHNPKRLLEQVYPQGKWNATIIREVMREVEDVFFAWSGWWSGLHISKRPSRLNVERLAFEAGLTPKCLGRTKDGSPRHPLYLKADSPLEVY